MNRLITKQMRDSFNINYAKIMFAFGLCGKVEFDQLLEPKQIKQRILILRRVVK